MTPVTAWFAGQAARERRAVALEEALIGNRFWSYAVYRLRYFFLQYLTAAGVHAARVTLIYTTFDAPAFLNLLVLHAAAALATSFWWGGLEVMRSDIRRLRQTSRPTQVGYTVESWLVLAVLVSAVMMVGSVAATIAVRSGGAAQQLYVFATVLRVALSCITQTFHSGVYAVRRIHRPAVVIAGVEVLGLGLAVALRSWFGASGLPAALIASSLVTAGCSLYYSQRAYRFLDIRLFSNATARWQLPRRFDRWEFAAAGLSFAVSRLDAFLVLALFAGPALAHDAARLPVLFALVSPTVRAGFDWARLFYFDLKRLDLAVYSRILDRFGTRLRHLAILLGLLFGAIAIGTAYAASPTLPGTTVWLLLPFFLSRSLLGYAVVRVFSARRYALLLGGGFFCLVGLLIVRATVAAAGGQLLFLSVLLLGAVALLEVSSVLGERSFPPVDVQWQSQWLSKLAEVREPVRVGSLVLVSDETKRRLEVEERQAPQLLAEGIARRLGSSGAVALIAPRRIIWYQRGGDQALTHWLPVASGGLTEDVCHTGVHSGGSAALRAAVRLGFLPSLSGRSREIRWLKQIPNDVEELEPWLKVRMPRGILYRPDTVHSTSLDSVSRPVSTRILRDALRFARDLGNNPGYSSFDVSSVWVAGELRFICALPRSLHRRTRSRWRLFISTLNVQLALQQSSTIGSES